MDEAVWDIGYLVASILFIMGLKKLGHPRTAPTGNLYGAMGMLVAVVVTIAQMDFGETNNFILVYPQALPDPNDDGSTNWIHKEPTTVDDVFFINALIDSINIDYLIDLERIYACGYSNGGIMSYALAC